MIFGERQVVLVEVGERREKTRSIEKKYPLLWLPCEAVEAR